MDAQNLMITSGASAVLRKLCGKPLEELGELLSDRVRYFRFQNQVAILKEVEAYALRAGIKLNPLGLKTLLPLLDALALEEDPGLQVLWARLLVNASDTAAPSSTCAVARELLKSISVHDAKVLHALHAEVMAKPAGPESPRVGNRNGRQEIAAEPPRSWPYILVSRSRLLEVTKLSNEMFEECFDSITRFNLIEVPERHNWDGLKLEPDHYSFTRLGWRVMGLLSERADGA